MNKLYYVEAKVTIRYMGVSGPYEETIVHLVKAANPTEARIKYEAYVRQTHDSPGSGQTFKFDYLKVGSEI